MSCYLVNSLDTHRRRSGRCFHLHFVATLHVPDGLAGELTVVFLLGSPLPDHVNGMLMKIVVSRGDITEGKKIYPPESSIDPSVLGLNGSGCRWRCESCCMLMFRAAGGDVSAEDGPLRVLEEIHV